MEASQHGLGISEAAGHVAESGARLRGKAAVSAGRARCPNPPRRPRTHRPPWRTPPPSEGAGAESPAQRLFLLRVERRLSVAGHPPGPQARARDPKLVPGTRAFWGSYSPTPNAARSPSCPHQPTRPSKADRGQRPLGTPFRPCTGSPSPGYPALAERPVVCILSCDPVSVGRAGTSRAELSVLGEELAALRPGWGCLSLT